jgi:riboflavin biosynthesis pyrimidine reductase
VGTQTVIDDNPKLDERLDWRQPCPNRFRSKQSPTKRAMYLTIKSKHRFYKTTTDTDKENLTFTVIDFEKHSNSN